jgi:hypothetical protein
MTFTAILCVQPSLDIGCQSEMEATGLRVVLQEIDMPLICPHVLCRSKLQASA